ncbi:MAG: hypothetical protein KDC92_01380 [Bacteroidetes bacterium]|nr:hypothetical protein [Bacteroidota bacterium]
MKQAYHIFLAIVFLVFISWPTITFFNKKKDETSQSENRMLAKMPRIKDGRAIVYGSKGTTEYKLDTFPDLFNQFWNDNFGTRDRLIKAHHLFKANYLQTSPVPEKVIVGKDGWLFMKGKPYECNSGKNKFTAKELASGLKLHQQRAKIMAEKDIPVYFFVAPNKHRIYGEHLPNSIVRLTDSIQVEQLNTLFAKHDNIHFIDLAPGLISAKEQGRLYHKTDNHWNDLGGYFAYQQIMEVIKTEISNEHYIPLSEFNVVPKNVEGIALARMLKAEKTMHEDDIRLSPKFTPTGKMSGIKRVETPPGYENQQQYSMHYINSDTSKPRLLFIRDSFGKMLLNELKNHFSEMLVIFDNWEYGLNETHVNDFKPDIVIYVVLERNLSCFLNGGSCGGNF